MIPNSKPLPMAAWMYVTFLGMWLVFLARITRKNPVGIMIFFLVIRILRLGAGLSIMLMGMVVGRSLRARRLVILVGDCVTWGFLFLCVYTFKLFIFQFSCGRIGRPARNFILCVYI